MGGGHFDVDTAASALLLGLQATMASPSQGNPCEVDCQGVEALEPEWRMVRAAAVDVAARAMVLGEACERFGAWKVIGWRLSLPNANGQSRVAMSLFARNALLQRWISPCLLESDDGDGA